MITIFLITIISVLYKSSSALIIRFTQTKPLVSIVYETKHFCITVPLFFNKAKYVQYLLKGIKSKISVSSYFDILLYTERSPIEWFLIIKTIKLF